MTDDRRRIVGPPDPYLIRPSSSVVCPPMSAIECLLDAKAGTGENPVWSPDEGALYWIDIRAPALHRLDPATGASRSWTMPDSIGAFALMSGGRALVALRAGLAVLDLATGTLAPCAAAPYDPATCRFNDGHCDRAGRFWVGSMRESGTGPVGLYRYDRSGLVQQADGIGQANGLAFSPDDRLLYHADTLARTIYAYPFDRHRGSIGERRTFVRVAAERGKPDGAAVDEEGCYWSACHGAGRLARYRPDGALDREILLPVSQPTMMAFGGADLDTLFVTSERHGLDAASLAREPLAGGIFRVAAGVRGLPEPAFSADPAALDQA
jgi:sugar lactone lactonase YvrE